MANKNFNLTVNEEDIKPILTTLLQAFVSRQTAALESCAKEINNSLDNQSAIDYIDSMMRGFVYERDFGFKDRIRRDKKSDFSDARKVVSSRSSGGTGGGY